jgi:hypothetical protein
MKKMEEKKRNTGQHPQYFHILLVSASFSGQIKPQEILDLDSETLI